ncbi:WD40-repeat-containing domain protein [Sporodiniella umbellata]|nr:WD40-repeat-containing domain protein [Sporodiniella umbellata]
MLAKSVEISWHDGKAIYSIDFSSDNKRYATAGADNSIRVSTLKRIWNIQKRHQHSASPTSQDSDQSKQRIDSFPVKVEFLSELKRHTSPVNVVRFSPGGDYLASAGDDACIIIWKLSPTMEAFHNEYASETWSVVHMFYGHNKEIYDLAWSPCGKYFITGSIDNTARVWSLPDRTCIQVLTDHSHYVQGVSWDPLGHYVATQSSDRTVSLYRYRVGPNGQLAFNQRRKFLKSTKQKESFHLYHDENLVTFFRRLSFSPDGGLLIAPSGLNRSTGATQEELELRNCAYLYARNRLLKQHEEHVGYIGNYPSPSIAVRWCPVVYKKRSNFPPAFALPYRMLYALATKNTVYIYDTQQYRPICSIAGMHYASLTDLTWSHDGSILMCSSEDGYCSAIVFSEGEMGTLHIRQLGSTSEDVEMKEVITSEKKMEAQETRAETQGATAEPATPKKRRIAPTQVK